MPTHRIPPGRVLSLVLAATFVATILAPDPAPGAVDSGSDLDPGAVDSGSRPFLRPARLPLRGTQHGGVGFRRGSAHGSAHRSADGSAQWSADGSVHRSAAGWERAIQGPRRGRVGPRRGAAAAWSRKVRARYAILVDPATGAVLWERRSRTRVAPASLTKMLTALAVRASLDLDAVTVASRVAARQPARRLAMRRGQRLTVDQALKALMIVSANDVAVMLAEAAGGSVARFSRAMDAESERLGLRASSWRNPHGLDARGHRSTAFDLAILARAVLEDRWLARVVRRRHAAFTTPSGRRHTLTARSRFLLGYRGAVGIKTGFTDDAGRCLAAAATRGGRTLIAVVLGSPDTAADAARLLDWGFGRGRSARTALRLPAYVPATSVAALLTRPLRTVERRHPAVPGTLAAAGKARVPATPVAPPAGSPAQWSWRDRQRVATGSGAVVAFLAALVLAIHRLRQRT
jgi:D-alanyl-D-alanine carboxypeptidase